MPKENVRVRPYKIEYFPNKYEIKETGRNVPLVVILRVVAEDGKCYNIDFRNTSPRFWVDENPDKVGISKEDRKLITDIKIHGVNGDGKRLYEIHVKYPFDTTIIRNYFKIHYQADITYVDAIRLFYGIKNIIKIPRRCLEGKKLYPEDIIPDTGKNDIPYNDWIIDIETDDEEGFAKPSHPTSKIVCMTLQRCSDGMVYHFTTAKPDSDFLGMIEDSNWLLENTEHDYGNSTVPEGIDRNNIVVYNFEDERSMLIDFQRFMSENDIAVINGHNTEYDVGYTTQRCLWKNKMIKQKGFGRYYPKVNFRKYQVFDNMEAYSKLHEGEVGATGRVALGWMSKTVLGYGKIKRDKISEMYKNNPNLLTIYNIWDCELVLRTNEVTNALNYFYQLAIDAGIGLNKCFSTVHLAEFTKMHYINPEQILISREFAPNKEPFEGAEVLEPYCGFIRNIIYLDNSKEYPSVVITGNTDNETRCKTLCESCAYDNICRLDLQQISDTCKKYEKGNVATFPSGNMYRLDKEGIIPNILLGMIERRDKIIKEMKKYDRDSREYKMLDNQQRVLKFLMNGFYGAFGFGKEKKGRDKGFKSRLQNSKIAGDITQVARLHLKWNIDFINDLTIDYNDMKLSFTVIYGDTDGIKVKINEVEEIKEEDLNKISDIILEKLNVSFDEFAWKTLGVKKHWFNVKKEDALEWFYMWDSKKRYAEKPFNKKKPKIVGAGSKRRDSSWNSRKAQNIFFNSLGKYEPSDIRSFLINFENEIRQGKWNWGCGQTGGIHTEGNHDYKYMTWSNKKIGTEHILGDVVSVYIVKKLIVNGLGEIPLPPAKKPEQQKIVLATNDNPDGFKYNGKEYHLKINYDITIKRDIESPFNYILKGLNFPSYQAFKSGFRQKGLGAFFE